MAQVVIPTRTEARKRGTQTACWRVDAEHAPAEKVEIVSDVASPWQNGYIESFYERFKHELGDLNRFKTAGEMIETIYRHIHYYTSQSHPHGSHDAACRRYCTNVLRHLSL
jgi:hypothetical protein